MPTANDIAFSVDWSSIVGVFNVLVGMINTPVALTVGLVLVFAVAAFVVDAAVRPRLSLKRKKTKRLPGTKSKMAAKRTPAGYIGEPVDVPPLAPTLPPPVRPTSDDPVEQSILDRLGGGSDPVHIDEVTQSLDLPAHQVSSAMTMLELKGVVKNEGLYISLVEQSPTVKGGDAPETVSPRVTKPVQKTVIDESQPRRPKRRSNRRPVLAVLVAWVSKVVGYFLREPKRPVRPDPNLIRPDYVPEIEPPPAKEYVSPMEQGLPEVTGFDELVTTLEQENAEIDQRLMEEQPEPRLGQIVRVFGSDPSKQYDLQYEVRELSDLVTSNTDSGTINPAYPAELQPRDRTRAASGLQIDRIAQALEPDALLGEFRALDRGAPIIGDDNAVESGNGRVLALRRAADSYQENYAAYKQRLVDAAPGYGLDPARLADYDQPVLVRRRVTDVDRVAFAQEANSVAILQMSDTEQARNDARRISTEAVGWLEVGDDIDRALRSARNRDFVRSFVAQLPDNERAAIIDREGDLTQSGLRRIKAALFNRVYDAPKLSDRLFESTDNDIKNITNGLLSSSGRLAQSEELVRQGRRSSDLSIAGDIAIAAEKLSSLKDQGLDVPTYLAQGQMFGRELTPVQERVLEALDERRRSGKKVGELVGAWADLVEAQPDPNQMTFFDGPSPSKDELVERWLKEPHGQMAMAL